MWTPHICLQVDAIGCAVMDKEAGLSVCCAVQMGKLLKIGYLTFLQVAFAEREVSLQNSCMHVFRVPYCSSYD